MSKDKLPKAPEKAAPEPERIIEAHAMIRADGGWVRMESAIPESVWAQHVTHVSDVNTFGMLTINLSQRLNAQKEKG